MKAKQRKVTTNLSPEDLFNMVKTTRELAKRSSDVTDKRLKARQ